MLRRLKAEVAPSPVCQAEKFRLTNTPLQSELRVESIQVSVCRAEFPEAKVEAVYVDLSDLKSVRDFGQKAQKAGTPLDVLCNNAGAPRMRNL